MEEPVYVSDRIAPVRRPSAKELFFLMVEAYPAPDSEEYGQLGGAFVNCWVDADDLRTAERQAIARIQEEGWRPYRLETWKLVTQDTYLNGPQNESEPDMRAIFAQALAEGMALILHTWPVDAPDTELAN